MDFKRLVEHHSAAGNSASGWISSADGLLAGAEVLREQRLAAEHECDPPPGTWRTHPPELMLRGMAVECLLKAVWLTRGGTLAADGRYMGGENVNGHDLHHL